MDQRLTLFSEARPDPFPAVVVEVKTDWQDEDRFMPVIARVLSACLPARMYSGPGICEACRSSTGGRGIVAVTPSGAPVGMVRLHAGYCIMK